MLHQARLIHSRLFLKYTQLQQQLGQSCDTKFTRCIPGGASGGNPAVGGAAGEAAPGATPGGTPRAGGAKVTLTDTEPLPGVGTVMFTETVPGGGGGGLSCGDACRPSSAHELLANGPFRVAEMMKIV